MHNNVPPADSQLRRLPLIRGVERHIRITTVIFLLLAAPLVNSESEDEYWNTWHQHSEKVSSCDSTKSVIEFLELALKNSGNAERTQANAETIERLIIEHPDCFCSAFVKLPVSSQAKTKQFFLQAPLFHERIKIDESLYSNRISKQCRAF